MAGVNFEDTLMNLNGQTPARPTASVDVPRSVPATPMSLAGPPPPPAATFTTRGFHEEAGE